MVRAIVEANQAKSPYGCVILDKHSGNIVKAANQTGKHGKTAHAEMEALRKLTNEDWKPENLILYTTAEPCPMCMAAIIWCGIQQVIYGVDIPTIENYHQQIDIRAQKVIEKSSLEVHLSGPFMKEECEELFEKFS